MHDSMDGGGRVKQDARAEEQLSNGDRAITENPLISFRLLAAYRVVSEYKRISRR